MYLYNYNEKVKAKDYLKMAVEFAKQTKSEESGYSVFATLYLLRIAKEEGKKDEAIAYAEQVTEFAEKKHEAYKEANEYLKQNKKKKFLFW
jgi:hypothetical protein